MQQPLELAQQCFADALLDAACEPALSGTVATFAAPAPLQYRIGLYRGNLQAHARGALANAYPVLLALVGNDYFDAVTRAYARAHPSQSGDLNRFGGTLPEFIGRYETEARFSYFVISRGSNGRCIAPISPPMECRSRRSNGPRSDTTICSMRASAYIRPAPRLLRLMR